MESLSRAAISRLASEAIYSLLKDPAVYYRVHKSQQQAPVLRNMNAVHILSPYILKIHFNIILLFMPRCSTWFLPSWFSDQNFVNILISSISCPSYPPRYD